jgi:arylsulfatase A-like enzyme
VAALTGRLTTDHAITREHAVPHARSRPNILYVMSDDHAAHAISAYGSHINRTPAIDRIADEGMRFDNAFCTNSICAPSRAAILTGTYNHVNGVTTMKAPMDAAQPTFPAMLRDAGYQTALFGKWHLGHGVAHDPVGFDDYAVLDGQGTYFDPVLIGPEGRSVAPGYVTDVVTDRALEWLSSRDATKPFCLLVHHKAPHRPWEPDERHAHLYADEDIPVPQTLHDDYRNRAGAAAEAAMRVGRDLNPRDLKTEPAEGLEGRELTEWAYQRYIKDYLRCVASVDDNLARLLDHLDVEGLSEDTIVVYTSDQGFFLGDHGWYDKRFMYEESLRMPLLVRYPRSVAAGSTCEEMVLNVDFAQTLLDLTGVAAHPRMQGRSLRALLEGSPVEDWRTSMYYRYWEDLGTMHRVSPHYGVRTRRHKLIYYHWNSATPCGVRDSERSPEWELFDLDQDPQEMNNVYEDPAYANVVRDLTAELERLQQEVGDTPYVPPAAGAGVAAEADAGFPKAPHDSVVGVGRG